MKRVLKWTAISFCAVFLLFIAVAIAANVFVKTAPPHEAIVTPAHPPTRAELLALVNAERAKYGAPPLVEDPRLDQSAQMKAEDENVHGYGHYCFGCMRGLDEAHKDLGNNGTYAENLVNNSPTSTIAVDAWIRSPEHHAAMIDPRYTLTGFGISGTQVVEHFYRP